MLRHSIYEHQTGGLIIFKKIKTAVLSLIFLTSIPVFAQLDFDPLENNL